MDSKGSMVRKYYKTIIVLIPPIMRFLNQKISNEAFRTQKTSRTFFLLDQVVPVYLKMGHFQIFCQNRTQIFLVLNVNIRIQCSLMP